VEEIMRILLAVDDSKFSEAAAQAVQTRAHLPGMEVRVVHVIEPPTLLIPSLVADGALGLWSGPEVEALWQAQRTQAEALLARVAEPLRGSGLAVTTSVEEGDPKSKIVDLAAGWHADLIVVGSHGRTGLGRFLLGSVAEAVARHAPCSVEIVRSRPAN
jgi:nucleotide-binding universal stress UspA family protein